MRATPAPPRPPPPPHLTPSPPPLPRPARQFLEIKWACFRPAALRSLPSGALRGDGRRHGFLAPAPAPAGSGAGAGAGPAEVAA